VCVLGIDVAKFELMAVLRWPDGSFQRPWRIGNPGEAGLLVEKLKGLGPAYPLTDFDELRACEFLARFFERLALKGSA